MSNKTKKVLIVMSIIWLVLLIIYVILSNTVIKDWYGYNLLKEVMRTDANMLEVNQAMEKYDMMINFANGFFVVTFVLIIIFAIVSYIKKK